MSKRRRPSLLGALLWISLGVLFLLQNFGIGPDFWSLAGRYWPVLLILLGLGKVIDYFLEKDAVSIRIGEIFGILLLLLVGSAITRISDSHVRPLRPGVADRNRRHLHPARSMDRRFPRLHRGSHLPAGSCIAYPH